MSSSMPTRATATPRSSNIVRTRSRTRAHAAALAKNAMIARIAGIVARVCERTRDLLALGGMIEGSHAELCGFIRQAEQICQALGDGARAGAQIFMPGAQARGALGVRVGGGEGTRWRCNLDGTPGDAGDCAQGSSSGSTSKAKCKPRTLASKARVSPASAHWCASTGKGSWSSQRSLTWSPA